MEYNMFSNEIYMEYVWNIQVPIVIWNISDICLIYDNQYYVYYSYDMSIYI